MLLVKVLVVAVEPRQHHDLDFVVEPRLHHDLRLVVIVEPRLHHDLVVDLGTPADC